MRKTRILLADDHDVVRSGLKALLRTSPEFAIVGEACDGEEAVRLVAELQPDIVMMDISMPRLDGIGATRLIKQQHPAVRIIVLTVYEQEEYVYQILHAGASGYVLKNAGKRELFDAIKAVRAGDRFFSPDVSRLIIDGFLKRAEDQDRKESLAGPVNTQLTKRETEVLKYIAMGHTNRQIAGNPLPELPDGQHPPGEPYAKAGYPRYRRTGPPRHQSRPPAVRYPAQEMSIGQML